MQLFFHAFCSEAFRAFQHDAKPRFVSHAAVEVAVTTHEQMLFEPSLQRAVCRLDIAVLLLLSDARRPRRHAEVFHQIDVGLVEPPLPVRRSCVAAVELSVWWNWGTRPSRKKRRLDAVLQRRKRLRVTDRCPLPIG